MISLWAIQLVVSNRDLGKFLKSMAEKHPTRTIGEIAENIKDWKRKFGLGKVK